MVDVTRATYALLMGNTYPNKDEIRALGATFDNSARAWKLPIEKHPMNNTKQRAALVKRLNALEERGVQICIFRKDRSEK